jgi:hypothetical protein
METLPVSRPDDGDETPPLSPKDAPTLPGVNQSAPTAPPQAQARAGQAFFRDGGRLALLCLALVAIVWAILATLR